MANSKPQQIDTLSNIKDFAVVAALDFGTTYSGYAYSFTTAPDDIKLKTDWGSGCGARRYKTLTCVLTDSNDDFVAFGYDAMNKFVDDQYYPPQYQLYDRFKMQLYREKVLEAKTGITSRNGRVLPAEALIAMSLKYLAGRVVDAIQKSNVSIIDKTRIRWVLTVPAIWSESAKQCMRRAALTAGIIDNLASRRLVIALEPEAASFWCRQLPIEQFRSEEYPLQMDKGTKYMILDCGGGTIDTTVHKVFDNNTIIEIYRATGGPWGGTTVDDKFVELTKDIFEAEFILEFIKESPQDWLHMMTTFETTKMAYDPTGQKNLQLAIPLNFGRKVKEAKKETVDDFVNKTKLNGVQCKRGTLLLPPNVIEKMFMFSLHNIIGHVQDLLRIPCVSDIKYIFLVGGYSDCEFIWQKIRENFYPKIIVMVPQDAGVCILRGAVLFGHTPESVVSRIARRTYGERRMGLFEPGKHDPRKKIYQEGQIWCDELFNVWVKKNETVKSGEGRIFIGCPHSSMTTEQTLYIYSSDKEANSITYVTDPGVEEIGKLTINIPDAHLDRYDRQILVRVYFGGTEIYVRLEDGVRGDHGDFAETFIDFLSDISK